MTDKELAKAVEAWGRSHKDEMVRDLIDIVNFKSVSVPGENGWAFGQGCKACADAMLDLAKSYGFGTENDDYYTVSILKPGTGEGELGILGHLDVVPEGDGWNYEPFNAIEKDGFVIGRGSSDNKGAVIMSLYVMRALNELGVKFKHTLRLICGFNEEAGMKDVEHYLQNHEPAAYTIVCDGGWAMCIGEKGILNSDIVLPATTGNLVSLCAGTAHNAVPGEAVAVISGNDADKVSLLTKGENITVEDDHGNVRIISSGKAGHAAFPQTGENAVLHLVKFLSVNNLVTGQAGEAIKVLADMFTDDYGTGLGVTFEDDESGKTTCVASLLRFADGRIVQHIDIRYAITQDTEMLLGQLRTASEAHGAILENLNYSMPRYSDPDSPITKMLLDTVHEFLGPEYQPYTMGGGTHARKFPNALPYGPGGVKNIENPFGNPHGIDEAVSIESLLLSMGTYAVALKRLDEML